MSDEDDLIAQERGAIEQLTVNLTPRSQAALQRVVNRTGDTRTDAVNRALQYYDALLRGEMIYPPAPKGFWRQVAWRLGLRP